MIYSRIQRLFMNVHKEITKTCHQKMAGLFMPFFDNNKRLKGCEQIEMDLGRLFSYPASVCVHHHDKDKSNDQLFSCPR